MLKFLHSIIQLIYSRFLVPSNVNRSQSIFTVRNEVAKVMFLQACVCPQGEGEYLTRYTPPGPDAPPGPGTPPRTRYTPPEPGTPPGPGTPPPGPRTPPEIRPLLRTVRILLECILVYNLMHITLVFIKIN